MNKPLSKLLLAILVWGSAFGVHSQERPQRPALKEHKSIAVPIWTVPDTKDKSRSSARERESPKPIPPKVPPTVMDRIPPKKIGDLSCPQVDDAAKQACDNECKNHPNTPCALIVHTGRMTRGNAFYGSNALRVRMSLKYSKRLLADEKGRNSRNQSNDR